MACRATGQCLLEMADQERVEVGIGRSDRHISAARVEQDFIRAGGKFDVRAEQFGELGTAAPTVSQSQAARLEAKPGEVSTNPHDRGHPVFHLVPIEMSADADVAE